MRLQALVGGSAEVIGPEASLLDAAEHMIKSSVGYLGVVARRELVGIFTEHDMVEAVAADADPEVATVSDWMSEAPDTMPSHVLVREAATWLLEAGYHHLPVMEDGELLGIVTVKDLLWALLDTSDGA
ncbi:MAG: CBS domain-containing protein [Acidimicrobiia bacterium]|nr:CBS domain-containing protein [Acidimicrobiia bacterium]